MNTFECVEFIAKWEGFVPNVYKCPAGIETFGYGFLRKDYPKEKLPITQERALELLNLNVTEYFNHMKALVKVDLTNGQEIALTSFCYNLGVGAFQRSTLRQKLNRKDYTGASEEFRKWVWAGGRKLKGLERRREEEKQLFLRQECNIMYKSFLQNYYGLFFRKWRDLISILTKKNETHFV